MSSSGSRASSTPPEPEAASPFDALEARLAALKDKMARGLPDRAAEIEHAATRLASGDVSARDDLRRLAHKLRGIAGSYGYPHLTELAGQLETLARSEASDTEVLARARDLASATREAGPQSGVVAKPEDQPAPRSEEPRKAAMPAVAPGLVGLEVLAADDDDATRRLLEITLVQLGRMKGALFDRGPLLLDELAKRERVDLVVVDAMMPDMNGLELIEAAVARGLASRVSRFVVLSAATAEELGWVLPPGLRVGWLRKPFRPKELLTALAALGND
jgi:CheY-like chemotaxis protein/HPt (histidine-containing phosphotransfer) domain-containing protein